MPLNIINSSITNAYNNGRTQGQNDVKSSPNSYGFYTSEQYNAAVSSKGNHTIVQMRQSILGHTPPTSYRDLRVLIYNSSGVCIADSGWYGGYPANTDAFNTIDFYY